MSLLQHDVVKKLVAVGNHSGKQQRAGKALGRHLECNTFFLQQDCPHILCLILHEVIANVKHGALFMLASSSCCVDQRFSLGFSPKKKKTQLSDEL